MNFQIWTWRSGRNIERDFASHYVYAGATLPCLNALVFMRNGEYDQACENMSLQVGSCWNLSHLTTSFHRANSAKQFHTDPFWFHHNGLCLSMCFVSFPFISYLYPADSWSFVFRLWSWASNLWGSKPGCLRHATRPAKAFGMHSRARSLLSLSYWLQDATG